MPIEEEEDEEEEKEVILNIGWVANYQLILVITKSPRNLKRKRISMTSFCPILQFMLWELPECISFQAQDTVQRII